MQKKGVVIAGLAGGSGKSVVAVGLAAALAAAGHRVAPFKKGPDYIDAGWLQLAAGRPCYNLDPYLMSDGAIRQSFSRRCGKGDLVIVEGNRGLYDGVNAQGGYSTADLATMLNLPVILVVNCTKTTRTVAAMVLGCQAFDPSIDIRGVILNQVATQRQRKIVSEAVTLYTGLPVLGAIPRMKTDIFPMRHLGMIPHQEYGNSDGAVNQLAGLVRENVELDSVVELMAPVCESDGLEDSRNSDIPVKLKIGVLQDSAFQFYYPENLEALQALGAELVFINAMKDAELPSLDGLYIGGGFPETGAGLLAANTKFRQSVKNAAEKGLPIYAECGGLIYLGESISLEGHEFPLVGIFSVRFSMSKKPQAHGYTILEAERENPFYPVGTTIKGHEFRYSIVESWPEDEGLPVMKMIRGTGFDGKRDGLVYRNVLALYTHVHAEGTPEWATNFISRCKGNVPV